MNYSRWDRAGIGVHEWFTMFGPQAFLDYCDREGPDAFESLGSVWLRYQGWLELMGFPPVSFATLNTQADAVKEELFLGMEIRHCERMILFHRKWERQWARVTLFNAGCMAISFLGWLIALRDPSSSHFPWAVLTVVTCVWGGVKANAEGERARDLERRLANYRRR